MCVALQMISSVHPYTFVVTEAAKHVITRSGIFPKRAQLQCGRYYYYYSNGRKRDINSTAIFPPSSYEMLFCVTSF